jgi:hypothetical protein
VTPAPKIAAMDVLALSIVARWAEEPALEKAIVNAVGKGGAVNVDELRAIVELYGRAARWTKRLDTGMGAEIIIRARRVAEIVTRLEELLEPPKQTPKETP